MKKLFFLFLFIVFHLSLLTAQVQWEKFYGGAAYDMGKKMLKTADGNIVVAMEESSADGLGGGNSGSSDVVIAKMSMEGDVLWSLRLGGTGTEDFGDLVPTADGGFVVVGTTDSPDGDVKTSGGQMDLFLAKITGEGSIEWTNAYGGAGNDRGFSALQIYDNGYLLVGEVGSRDGIAKMQPFGGIDGWILRLDNKGKLIWERRFGGASIDRVNGIHALAPNGVMHTYRAIATTMSNNNHLSKNLGGQDIWAFTIDEYGKMAGWSKVYGGEMDEDSHISKMNLADSTIMIAGTTFSTNGNIKYQKGLGDCWLLKIDNKGDVVFSETYGGSKQESATDVLFTKDGGYLITGMTQSKDGQFPINNGYYDGFILKIDKKGTVKWAKTAGFEKKDFLYSTIELGKTGYLSLGMSELTKNGAQVMEHNGKLDTWLCFFDDLPLNLNNTPTLAGNVFDKSTKKPMKVYIKLTNLETMDSIQSVSTNPDDGAYLMVLPKKGKVSFGTLKPGYLFYGDDLDLTILATKPNAVIRRNIELEPIKMGAVMHLDKVYFNSAQSSFSKESVSELAGLVTFMRINPKVKILLSGYASFLNDGADKVNLSLARAVAVQTYLTQHGISDTRIQVETGDINQQLYTEMNEEVQWRNRRVEVKIIGL
jgi:outer membrane protein OmpA-like peptidoglycan-associated protein/outer membrane protein assembly factor BamB